MGGRFRVWAHPTAKYILPCIDTCQCHFTSYLACSRPKGMYCGLKFCPNIVRGLVAPLKLKKITKRCRRKTNQPTAMHHSAQSPGARRAYHKQKFVLRRIQYDGTTHYCFSHNYMSNSRPRAYPFVISVGDRRTAHPGE
jgi:hypothetical protein